MGAPRRAWPSMALVALFLLAGCGGQTPDVVEPTTPAAGGGVEVPPTATGTPGGMPPTVTLAATWTQTATPTRPLAPASTPSDTATATRDLQPAATPTDTATALPMTATPGGALAPPETPSPTATATRSLLPPATPTFTDTALPVTAQPPGTGTP